MLYKKWAKVAERIQGDERWHEVLAQYVQVAPRGVEWVLTREQFWQVISIFRSEKI